MNSNIWGDFQICMSVSLKFCLTLLNLKNIDTKGLLLTIYCTTVILALRKCSVQCDCGNIANLLLQTNLEEAIQKSCKDHKCFYNS